MAEESGSLHVPLDVRRVMLRAFTKKRHLQLQSDAVQFMYRTLEEHDLLVDEDATTEAIDALASALVDQHVAGANICLLYTSPSPRDGLLSRMPSSA